MGMLALLLLLLLLAMLLLAGAADHFSPTSRSPLLEVPPHWPPLGEAPEPYKPLHSVRGVTFSFLCNYSRNTGLQSREIRH
eukprot:SAG31_NODE_27715_length_421_cov_0.940994_1_plen_80_part_10